MDAESEDAQLALALAMSMSESVEDKKQSLDQQHSVSLKDEDAKDPSEVAGPCDVLAAVGHYDLTQQDMDMLDGLAKALNEDPLAADAATPSLIDRIAVYDRDTALASDLYGMYNDVNEEDDAKRSYDTSEPALGYDNVTAAAVADPSNTSALTSAGFGVDSALEWFDSHLMATVPLPPRAPVNAALEARSADDLLFRSEPRVEDRFVNWPAVTITASAKESMLLAPTEMPAHWHREIVVYSEERKDLILARHSELVQTQGLRTPLKVTLQSIRLWNEEYQSKYDEVALSPFEQKQRAELLAGIMRDFVAFSETIATRIVTELHLPVDERSIRPAAELGGVAGGEKYVFGNVMFKFAHDLHGIFGSDEFAAKAAANEIRAINALTQCGISLLHSPLTVLLQIQGYSIIATAFAPISRATLVLGSDDAGKTVKSASPGFNAVVAQLGERLRLKKHVVLDSQDQPHEMWVAGDVEGHISKEDGRRYICDLARLIPALPPRHGHRLYRGDHLHRTFRPEFIAQYAPVPVSSDVFSRWGRHDATEHHRDAFQALEYMREAVLPALAEHIDEIFGDKEVRREFRSKLVAVPLIEGRGRSDSSNAADQGSTPSRLHVRTLFHHYGVNLRELGAVLELLQTDGARQQLVQEMVGRCLKRLMRRFMRKLGPHLSFEQREAAVTLGHSRLLQLMTGSKDSAESQTFWEKILPAYLSFHYGGTVAADSTHVSKLKSLPKTLVWPLLQDLAAVDSPSSDTLRCLAHVVEHLQILQYLNRSPEAVFEAVQSTLFSLLLYDDAKTSDADAVDSDAEPVELPPLASAVRRKIMEVPKFVEFVDAEAQLKQELVLREQAVGTDSPSLLQILFEMLKLYSAHVSNMKIAKDKSMQEKGVRIAQRALQLSQDQPFHHKTLLNVITFYESIGLYEAVEDLYDVYLSTVKSVFGERHPTVAGAIVLKATSLERRGDARGKIQLLEDALDIQLSSKRASTRDIIMVLNNIGVGYQGLGNAKKFLEYSSRALDLCVQSLGWENPDTLQTLHNKARALAELGRYAESVELDEKHMKLASELHGAESSEYAKSLMEIGITVGDRGDLRRQQQLFQQALSILLQNGITGKTAGTLIALLRNSNSCARKLGDYRSAHQLARRAWDESKKWRGEQDGGTASCWAEFGRTYMELKDYHTQVEIMEKALAVQISLLGEDHNEVASTIEMIGCGYGYLDMKEIEESYIRRALAIRKKVLGPDHPNVTITKMNLANVLGYLNQNEEKRSMLEECLKEITERVGPSNPSVGTCMMNLALACMNVNDVEAAARHSQNAYRVLVRHLGPDHPSTRYAVGFMNEVGIPIPIIQQ